MNVMELRKLQDAGSMIVHEGWWRLNKRFARKHFEYINYQIWSLLSGFCNGPTDLATSFNTVGSMM